MREASTLNAKQLQLLSELRPPVLTTYVKMGLSQGASRATQTARLTWLNNEAKSVVESVPAHERQIFQEQLRRVHDFLLCMKPQQGNLVFFAGPTLWEEIAVPYLVKPELYWGNPELAQLFWMADERKPYGVVVIDRHLARFFRCWHGGMALVRETDFRVDVSQWKKKDMGHQSRPNIRKTHGSQRDTFEQRMSAQYDRLLGKSAISTEEWCRNEGFRALFLVGSDHLIQPMYDAFSSVFRSLVVRISEDLGNLTSAELEKRLDPKIHAWERAQEIARVEELLGAGQEAVLGLDETLFLVQEGKIRTILVARDFDAKLCACLNCGWLDHSADPVCSVCRGPRSHVMFRKIAPSLALRHDVDFQFVGGKAADRLRAAGGIGAWLRTPKLSAVHPITAAHRA
jgi:hypothetical protein